MRKPVDCHCHIDFSRYDDDRAAVIRRAKQKLQFIVNAGCSHERNKKTLRLAEKHPQFISIALGIHPTFTDDFGNLTKVKEQIRDNNPAAIGEIGLDHHHVTDNDLQKRQEEVFREFLELAQGMNKPVVVHSREAEQETINILKEYNIPETMVHCFNGTPEQAGEAVENGFTIGVTTQVLYSNKVQKIVKELNIENIVLETDSPFLYQGERNEPVNVVESAEKIASLKNISVEQVIEETSSNANRIFR